MSKISRLIGECCIFYTVVPVITKLRLNLTACLWLEFHISVTLSVKKSITKKIQQCFPYNFQNYLFKIKKSNIYFPTFSDPLSENLGQVVILKCTKRGEISMFIVILFSPRLPMEQEQNNFLSAVKMQVTYNNTHKYINLNRLQLTSVSQLTGRGRF